MGLINLPWPRRVRSPSVSYRTGRKLMFCGHLVFFNKAHPTFPLLLHIKIRFDIMLLDTAHHCANTSDGSF